MKKTLRNLGFLAIGASVLAIAGGVAIANRDAVEVAATGETTTTTPTTFRIWMNRNGRYINDGDTWNLTYEGGTAAINAEYTNVTTQGLWLAHFDVPVEAIGKKIYFNANGGSTEENGMTLETTYNSGDNAQVYYINYDETTKVWSLSQGIAAQYFSAGGDNNKLDVANCLGAVFYPYSSCDSSPDYGYGAFEQLAQTWFRSAPDATTGAVTWYTYGDLGGTLTDEWNGTTGVDGWNKYSMMLANYNKLNPSSGAVQISAMETAAIVTAISIMGAAAVITTVGTIVRRKRDRA